MTGSRLRLALPIVVLMAIVRFESLPTAQSVPPPPDGRPPLSRIELRVASQANRTSGAIESCDVVQAKTASEGLSFASWSSLGASSRCGPGALPAGAPSSDAASEAPPLIQDVSAVFGWSSGTMDPGPVGAFQVSLTVTSRQLAGMSREGQPTYTAVTDRRVTRLEPGEEYVVPVRLEARAREALGVHEVLLRVRAGWAGREPSAEYGTVMVVDAAPGSEILLDGGVAGRAAADGSLRLAHVPTGQREIRFRSASGSAVARVVSVVNGRTTPVAAPDATARPSFTPAGKNPQGFQEYRRVRDEAVMIGIPAGEFLMGNLETEGAPLPHTVNVSAFLMDKLPLTVGRYKRFAAATGRPLPPDPYWGVHDEFPVAFVRWDEARAYCEWVGGRLPTEAEREKATRGTDGRLFPWGSEQPSKDRGVFRGNWGEDGNDAVGTRPAGASPYGLLDTGGNMWEFCEDWWGADYFKVSPAKDPAGPKTGMSRVVKGGSWDSRPTVLSASSRNFAYTGYREGDFGFRCAADPPR